MENPNHKLQLPDRCRRNGPVGLGENKRKSESKRMLGDRRGFDSPFLC